MRTITISRLEFDLCAATLAVCALAITQVTDLTVWTLLFGVCCACTTVVAMAMFDR